MKLESVKKEIEKEKHLEAWARRCTKNFQNNMRRLLFEEIDNMIWGGSDDEIMRWCNENKVYDEITEKENEEIWMRQDPVECETV